MKPKEEYLLLYEDRLLTKLDQNYKDLNRNILFCFSLMFIFILFKFNLLEDTTIFGNKIKFTKDQLLIVLPLIITFPYFLVNNSVRSIARIVNQLIKNSQEITKLNQESRPFQPEDLEFLSTGIGGLQLQFSKWIVKKYLTNNNFSFSVNVPNKVNLAEKIKYSLKLPYKLWREMNILSFKALTTLIWILFLVLIYILPLVTGIYIIYTEKLESLFQNFHFLNIFNWCFLISILLAVMIIYTLISNLLLYSLYFTEITELEKNINYNTIDSVNSVFGRIINYYKSKKEDNTI